MTMTLEVTQDRLTRSAGNSRTIASLAFSMLLLSLVHLGLAANEGGKTIAKTVGDLKVEMVLADSGAKVGNNDVMFRIHDAEGKAVTDATLALAIAMDQGSAMSMDMNKEKTKTVPMAADSMEAGMYKGSVELGFKGKWIASLDLTRGAMMGNASFDFEVADAGPNWTILLVFGLVIVVVIGSAVALRSRKPKIATGSAA